MKPIKIKQNKTKKFLHKKQTNKFYKLAYNKSINTLPKNSKKNNYRIITLEDINKNELKNILKKIFSKNEHFPMFGYFTNENSIKILNPKMTFFIFKSNLFIGMIFFKNMTYDFKKSLLGTAYMNDNQLKSKSDINNYIVNWLFIHNDINKNLFDIVCNKFRKNNNLMNKNIIITALNYINFINDNYNEKITDNDNDILYRYKKIVNYQNYAEYNKLIKLGFIYNNYHISMHNELFNIYSIRFIKNVNKDDFFPTYIIGRQIKNEYAINLTSIKKLLNTDGLISLDNIKKFSIDNTLLYYTNQTDNEIYSVFSSMPYKFMFVMNFIVNDLGNSHIIKKYSILYNTIINDNIIKHKDLDYFCEVITSYSRALELLDSKESRLILSIFPIKNYDVYLSIGFTKKKDFEDYIVNNEKKVLHGYYLRNYNFINKRFQLKNNNNYYLAPYMLFTYINQKLKCYIYSDIALVIFKQILENLFNNKEFDNQDYLVMPQLFHKSFNNFASRNLDVVELDNIVVKIRKLCGIIGKAYKKHVNLNINQMNGFCAIHPMITLVKENNEIIPKIYNINPDAEISNSNNYEMSEWIYNLAIKPALYPDYKCDREELYYQPLDIE